MKTAPCQGAGWGHHAPPEAHEQRPIAALETNDADFNLAQLRRYLPFSPQPLLILTQQGTSTQKKGGMNVNSKSPIPSHFLSQPELGTDLGGNEKEGIESSLKLKFKVYLIPNTRTKS